MVVERFSVFWQNFTQTPLSVISVLLSIIAFSVIYYFVIRFLLENESDFLVIIFTVVMVLGALCTVFFTAVNGFVFLFVPAICLIVFVCIYSVEIKRLVWNITSSKVVDIKQEGNFLDAKKVQNSIDEIIKALQNMSKNDIGAIIVLSNGNMPSQILDSGTLVDAEVSSQLIESIFFPKTPLHDGAMILNGTKIEAAGCFLPLSQKDNISKDLGSRHRAGIGVTEVLDVETIIVSEETGIISTVKAGKITRYVDTEGLKKVLSKYYWQETESSKK